MTRRMLIALFALGWGWTPAHPQATAAAPAAPANSFATVVSLLGSEIKDQTCVAGQTLEAGIGTPFTLGDEPLVEDARLRGRILSCNRNPDGHLSTVALAFDQLVLASGHTVPIEAVLQALGANPPHQFPRNSKQEDIGFGTTPVHGLELQGRNTLELATRGNTDVGQLDRTSHGVVGLRHVSFENMPEPPAVVWLIASDRGALKLPQFAQLVVRFRIARPTTPAAAPSPATPAAAPTSTGDSTK